MDQSEALLQLIKCFQSLKKLQRPRLIGTLEFHGDADVDLHEEAAYVYLLAERLIGGSRSMSNALASLEEEVKSIHIDYSIGPRIRECSPKDEAEKTAINNYLKYDELVKSLAQALSDFTGIPIIDIANVPGTYGNATFLV